MSATPVSPSSLDTRELRERALALHGDVHGALSDQFAEVLRDLQQLRGLLGDATGKLSVAFQTMIHQARSQRAAAESLEARVGAEVAREVRDLAEEITRGSVMVVQSLQFEDMATQLLAHVDRRLAWLESFARDAAPLQTAVHGDVVGLTIAEFAEVERSLGSRRAEMAAWGRKAVQQQSMDEGDIELF